MFRILTCLAVEHDWRLVLLAAFVCFLASITAINLFRCAQSTTGRGRAAWIVTAGAATGCGIWATHFIAMLAYEPGVPTGYDIGLTALSLVVAIGITCIGLSVPACRPNRSNALAGGAILGGGIACMHYLGMWALEVSGWVTWQLHLVTASVALGVLFGMGALAVAVRHVGMRGTFGAALLLTLAIVSHHFTAMGAAEIVADPARMIAVHSLSTTALAVAVAGAALTILGMCLIGAIADRRLAARTEEFGAQMGELARDRQRIIEQSNEELERLNKGLERLVEERTAEAHRALETKARLDLALQNMMHGICMFDANKCLLVCNDRYAKMYQLPADLLKVGTPHSAIIGHRVSNGILKIETNTTSAQEKISALTGLPHDATSTRVDELSDGRLISVVRVPMKGGGWVATHEDVTAQQQAEAERARAALELETIRARELAAIEANTAKSAFLAMMSHEIRTPMNAVIGLSASLLESKLDNEQQHVVHTIHESSDSLLRLLNDILDISKLEAGKVEFETIPFAPATVVKEVISILQTKAAEKGLLCTASIDPLVPQALLGDPVRLRQVLLNLVSNAIKFTETGSVEVAVRTLSRTDKLAAIECSVRDTGIGIAPENIGRLFHSFVQANETITRQFGGTGLGLAISKKIIERLGGEITVESTVGAGTTFAFKLTLPLSQIAPVELPHREDSGPGTSAFQDVVLPLRILLAEDNGTNQLVFSKLVQSLGVHVTYASNGREAVEHASSGSFDVIFMDMRMPEMDGLEATRKIRALDGHRSSIPIIALTANAFADDIKACHDAGMNDFVAKPIRKKTLVEKLTKIVADRPPVRQQAMAASNELPLVSPAVVRDDRYRTNTRPRQVEYIG
jgi:signal transduction histidine kinase/NO-binding membrane sensor protein with MHYT domain/DNA-binding NarL/FixJ family response regulator